MNEEAEEANDITTFVYTGQPKNDIPRDIVEVIVDSSVRIIHNNTFQDCQYLSIVKLPQSLRIIGKRAFERCPSLEYVYIHDGLKVLGRQAFRDCSSLVHIRLPESLISIRKGILDGCDSLQSITIPRNIETIGKHAFRECTSLTKVNFQGPLQVIGTGAFWKCESIQTLVLPESIETIQDEAFVWCHFPSISIPASVKTIGIKAFSGCAWLTSVKLEEGIQSLGRYSFCSCDLLVHISLPVGLKAIHNRAFLMCISLRTISIPGTVERIGDGAFASCSALAEVELNEGLQVIGPDAFIRCRHLSGIVLPTSLEEIGAHAFFNCISLQCIQIPSDSEIKVGKKAFAGCKSLITISIPDATRFVTDDAFSRCELLQDFDAIWSIRERFEAHPVHNVCYQASFKSLDDLVQVLNDSSSKNPLEDPFGMTPLHILATAPNPRVDFLECLLDHYDYPYTVLGHKDRHSKSMMYNMLNQTSSKVIPIIKVILRRAVIERISKWGVPEKWHAKLERHVDLIHSDDPMERNNSVYLFFDHARRYARVEMTLFLELALWRMKIAQIEEKDENYREICRYQCGADVVVENVVGFLWKGRGESWATSASVLPRFEVSEWAPWF